MAGRSEEVGESTAHERNSSPVVNGVEKDSLGELHHNSPHLPSMESMLEAATDLQGDHSERNVSQMTGRLELNHPAVESHQQMQNTGRLNASINDQVLIKAFR